MLSSEVILDMLFGRNLIPSLFKGLVFALSEKSSLVGEIDHHHHHHWLSVCW